MANRTESRAETVIALVGNPNCGKSTLFNALTGARQEIGNWPGVTVEKKLGRYQSGRRRFEVVDLPGLYSLGASVQGSEDERIARDFVLSGDADLVVNIVDGSNLERNLFLTTQLLEMQVPILVAVNMMDIVARRGLAIDIAALGLALGCPVVGLVAARGEGVAPLKEAIDRAIDAGRRPGNVPRYGEPVEREVTALAARVEAMGLPEARWRALTLLEGDAVVTGETQAALEAEITAARGRIETETGEDADIVVADARFGFVTQVIGAVLTRPRDASHTLSDAIDRVVLNRWFGIPVFLLMMYLMFVFTISVGGAFIDFFDIAFGAVFVDGVGQVLRAINLPEWLVVVIADGLGGGVQTVSTFIPVIAFLYLFLSFLEDSGYMARAAFVMDRAMRAIGLPGKAFVPLIVGFGCNVPAIMATRTLESRHDRVLTIMMAPFMSCGARLPVYALFAAAFFPASGQNLVFLLYLIGIAAAVGTGLLLKSTVLKGDASPFIMELPPYHLPTGRTVLLRAWDRLKAFVFRAGSVIVPVVLVLNVLNSIGTDGSFGNQDQTDSVLSATGRAITPVFAPMGMTEDNWPAAVGVVTGILAKEAVIGTLNALYTQLGNAEAGVAAEEETATVGELLAEAVATIPANLGDAAGSLADPLGLDVSFTEAGAGAAEELEVAPTAFSAMASRFDGQAGAFAYLLMILLYMPCVAAIGAIYHEVGWGWTAFSGAWTTGLGWTAATLFYQTARFSENPGRATLWIGFCLLALAGAMAALHATGKAAARNRDNSRPAWVGRVEGAG